MIFVFTKWKVLFKGRTFYTTDDYFEAKELVRQYKDTKDSKFFEVVGTSKRKVEMDDGGNVFYNGQPLLVISSGSELYVTTEKEFLKMLRKFNDCNKSEAKELYNHYSVRNVNTSEYKDDFFADINDKVLIPSGDNLREKSKFTENNEYSFVFGEYTKDQQAIKMYPPIIFAESASWNKGISAIKSKKESKPVIQSATSTPYDFMKSVIRPEMSKGDVVRTVLHRFRGETTNDGKLVTRRYVDKLYDRIIKRSKA